MAALAVANCGERGALHSLVNACESFSELKDSYGFLMDFSSKKGFLPVYKLFWE